MANQFEDKVRAIDEFKYVSEYRENPAQGSLSFQLYGGEG